MVAVEALSAGWRLAFFGVAVVLFAVAAFAQPRFPKLNLVAAGLALFVFPFAWDALAST